MLAATTLGWRVNGALTLGVGIGDEPQAFPVHGCERPRRSDPCVAGTRRSWCCEAAGEDWTKSRRTWRRGVFQNAVGIGGGEARRQHRKGERGKGEQRLAATRATTPFFSSVLNGVWSTGKAMNLREFLADRNGWRRGKADEFLGVPSAAKKHTESSGGISGFGGCASLELLGNVQGPIGERSHSRADEHGPMDLPPDLLD